MLCVMPGVIGFQSLIGRLKTYPFFLLSFPIFPFQSLIGRLKTPTTPPPPVTPEAQFQSLIGRLKTWEESNIKEGKTLVSIPYR